jgi:phenylalanyl-tRNA synthetase beta chain
MKFTLSWLKDHLDTTADVKTIAETLTRIGLEVEHVEDKAAALAGFIVARIITAEPHPGADKLQVCSVDTGKETLQVVCGAPNARAGLIGVFAPPDTYVPGSGITLKIAKIRGVESYGMLCSERELELSGEHEGIIELPANTKIGSPATDALGLNDPVIEIALTPNRGDCTGVYGIARDLAAAGLGTLKSGSVAPVPGRFASNISVALEFPEDAADACPLFVGRLIRGVKNGPSPAWLQQRLRAIGLRPISALVDVTNYIAYDRGRPLHVFDAAKLKGNVRARLALAGETLRALDGRTYTLDPGMTVIADQVGAQGIAGVMGGEDTGCAEATTDVFIESALFDPARVARAGRSLGILSDARYRFERGVDPAFVVGGAELATKLILEFCGGEPSELVSAGAMPHKTRDIQFPLTTVKRLAGLELDRKTITGILERLGFALKDDGDGLRVTAPSWRNDIEGRADLVEEIVRIHGLDAVPSTPMTRPSAVARPVLTLAQRRMTTARRILAARGFDECVHISFIAREQARLFGGGDDARQLENPIAADLDSLRPSVLPTLLGAVQRNQARGLSPLMLFELGPQFASGMPGDQTLVAAGLRAGEPRRHWSKKTPAPDALAAEADALIALESVWGQKVDAPISAQAPSWYHPGRAGTIALGPKTLCHFGELHPAILAAFDIKGPVAAFEIFLDAIPEPKTKAGQSRGALRVSDFQAVERDFAFIVDAGVSAEKLVKAARGADKALIERVDVFDVYEGKGVPEGKKSLAISVRLQPLDATLTNADIEAVAQKIVNAVIKATGGSLRL